MSRTILTVGTPIPGDEAEFVDYVSSRSLLDADIIFFSPLIPYREYARDTYQGRACLSDDSSFRAREAILHWRRELGAALGAGKLIVLFLTAPEIVFAATGEKTYSGTGKNARATRIVAEMNSYEAIPVPWKFVPASGIEMLPSSEAKFFLPLWTQFSEDMGYKLYLKGEIGEPLLRTKSGERVVGACLRKGKGALIAIPQIDFDDPDFTELRGEGAGAEEYWTEKATAFGKKLISAICAMSKALASEVTLTPPPEWTQLDKFQLPEEMAVRVEIDAAIQKLSELDEIKRGLDDRLAVAGSLRALLFEQGRPLEAAVLEALELFGFAAAGHNEDGSEFDAVFSSSEGRFLGEVEGKDNRSINIDKFSQLERNLSEDFQREEVSDYAKGVLFGNAFRLRPPAEREAPFTAKCFAAAVRLKVALVNTSDMFAPARYLKSNNDNDYARDCRRAIFCAEGTLVIFPSVPDANLQK